MKPDKMFLAMFLLALILEVQDFCDFLLNLLSKAMTRAGKQNPDVYETLIRV